MLTRKWLVPLKVRPVRGIMTATPRGSEQMWVVLPLYRDATGHRRLGKNGFL
jgi:hypothetical protein